MPNLTPADETDDEKFFDELLTKRGEKWLATHLEKLKAELIPAATPGATGAGDFAGFLNKALAETKAEAMTLREKLEAALDLLTPEQRTLLRSAKKESAEGNPLQKPNALPVPPNVQPPAPPPPESQARKFLKRL